MRPSLFILALLRPLLASSTDISADAIAVCNEIFEAIPERTAVNPDGPNADRSSDLKDLYKDTTNEYWDEANTDDKPACIVFPASAEDVSIAVKALLPRPSVPFATKSGGHQFNRGWSSTNGGVLISFRPKLASTSLSADGKTAKVGPGARWSECAKILDGSDKTLVGGRIGHVVVGGYILGGGLSFLAAQYGFASDNVVNFEAVLANGTIVDANEKVNPDLFWALKGGGNIFAIVTMFTLKAHDTGDVWGGEKVYTPDKLSDVASAVTNFVANNNDPKAALIPTIVMIGPVNLVNVFTVFFFYDGPEPPADVFAEFDAITPLLSTVKTQRYPDLLNVPVSAVSSSTANGVNSFPNMDHDNMTSFLEWHWHQANKAAILRSVEDFDLQMFSMALQPIPASLQKASASNGPSALSLDPRNGDKIWVEYNIGWKNPACDQACPKTVRDLLDEAKNHHTQKYAGFPPTNYESGDLSYVPYNPLFMNDAQETQDVLTSYGAENYARLKAIHQSLDPDGFFLNRQKAFGFHD